MGQRRDPVDVATVSSQSGSGPPWVRPAQVAGVEPDGVEPQPVDGRPAAGGDQHLVDLQRPGTVGQGEHHGSPVGAAHPGVPHVLPGRGDGLGGEPDRHPGRLEPRHDQVGDERLGPRQHAVAPDQQRDLGAQRGHPPRGLAGDHPAPDDRKPGGHVQHPGRVARAPGADVSQRRGHDGHAAGREHDRLPRPQRGTAPSGSPAAVTSTVRSPARRPRPRTTEIPAPSAHSTWPLSSYPDTQ